MMNVVLKGKTLVLLVGAVLAAAELRAKTVCWYHFDECEPGTVTTEVPMILNSVDRNVGVGTPMYYWNDGKGTSAAYMPVYSNAFPKGYVWADQTTGTRGTLNRALQVVNPPVYGQYGNGAHGIVSIADSETFHLQSFTVEMFVKDMVNDETYLESSKSFTQHYVIAKKNSWSIAVSGGSGNGSNTMDWSVYRDNDGAPEQVVWGGTNGNMKPSVLRDGRWHHLALTVDGSDPSAVKVRYYIDYCEMRGARLDMIGPVYYDDSPITIGIPYLGSKNNGWNGLIDELRISDEVLQPKDFLKYCNQNTDADTALYCSYDFFLGNPFFKAVYGYDLRYYVNEVSTVNPVYPGFLWRDASDVTKPDYDAVCAGTAIRNGVAANEWVTNGGSLRPHYNSAFQTCALTLRPEGDQRFFNDDHTIEMFVKLDQLPTDDQGGAYYLFRGIGTSDGPTTTSWYVQVLTSGKLLLGINWTKTVQTPTAVMADLGWHHVAVVVSPSNRTEKLYVDYRLAGSITGEPYVISDNEKDEIHFYSYAEQGWSNNSFKNGLLDDIRITKRALDPQEFLTTRPIDATLVAAARFEGDFTVGPYFAPVPDGVPSAGVSFATKVPAKTIVDGNGGTVAETNAKSVWLAGGTVDFGRNMPLENADEMTVEFFLRPEVVAEGGAEVMKLAATDGTVWAIRLSADRKTLSLVADTAAEVGQVLEFPVDLGPRWNHLAFTFAKRDGNTLVTAYRNGSSPVERTLTGTLKADGKSSFTLGSEGLSAYVDELRVSPTVLAPAAFMVCPDAPGMVLIFK